MHDISAPTLLTRRIIDNVSRVIVGKTQVIESALAARIAQGHLLVEDVPGVGNTMLAKSLATSIGCTFKRIQFTPDLLPSYREDVSVLVDAYVRSRYGAKELSLADRRRLADAWLRIRLPLLLRFFHWRTL